MFGKLFLTGILLAGLCLSAGCAAKVEQEEKADTGMSTEVKKPEKDQCESIIDQAVQEARDTMRTVKTSCKDLYIEVNPMWSMDYSGAVHIRSYDANGETVRDEYRK